MGTTHEPDALPAKLLQTCARGVTSGRSSFEMLLFKVYSHSHGPTCGVTQIH